MNITHQNIYNTNNNEFVQKLKKLIRDGSGLTPFLGSGCSSASGIIMGQEFTDYLGYVVYRCVKQPVESPSGTERRWDIGRQGWPDRPNQDQVLEARAWALKEFISICGKDIHITDDKEHRVQSFEPSDTTTTHALLAKMLAAPLVPPFLRSPNLLGDGDSITSIRNSLNKGYIDHRFYLQSSYSPTSYAAICEKALRSMSDWRATLQFLASLRSSRNPDLLSIEEPSQSVIDSFNVHITRNRRPNLTHMMIAQLSMSARIRVVLTTNFDSLLESAFHSFGRHLSMIPVGLNEPLPHPDRIHESDCVVKLHGDCHETRADFSLDSEPSPEDKRRFFHYVRGRFPAFDLPSSSVEEAFIPSDLLVIGYSGSDKRCNEMLKYVLDADKNSTIYWICHSQYDLERLNRRFSEEDYRGGRIVATVSERPDLLLYDFYQKLNLTLPSAGLTYQFPDRVLPAKDPGRKSGQQAAILSEGEKLANKLTSAGVDANNQKQGALVAVTGSSGVLKVIHEAFHILGSRGKQRIWIELEDFPTIPVVGAEIFTSLAERTGALPMSYMRPLPRGIWTRDNGEEKKKEESDNRIEAWRRFFTESCEDLGLSAHNWVIGFYGRNGPGGCCGWSENQYWITEDYPRFHDLLLGLTLSGFSVIYAPYDEDRDERDKRRAEAVRNIIQNEEQDFKYTIPPDKDFRKIKELIGNFFIEHKLEYPESDGQRFDDILKDVWRDLLEPSLCDVSEVVKKTNPKKPDLKKLKPKQLEWRRNVTALYATTLYRQSRHFSAFLNDAVFRCPYRFNIHHFDNDANRVKTVETWLEKLAENGFFYTKPGGFAWAYRDTRLAFRHIISQIHNIARTPKDENDISVISDVKSFKARASFHIGEWYARAHRVTHHPMPLIEALHHFYQSAIFACDATEREDSDYLSVYRLRLFFQALTAIHHALRTGIESLRYWSSNPAIAYFCEDFPNQDQIPSDNEPRNLTSSLKELMIGIENLRSKKIRAESNSIRCGGENLINRIKIEIDTIHSKLRHRDPIVRFDSYQENAKDSVMGATPSPNIDAVIKNWMRNPFKSVKNIIKCANEILLVDADNPDMGENLWKKIGQLELEYFADYPNAFYNPRIVHMKVQQLVEWSFIFIRRGKRLARVGDARDINDSYKESSIQCYLISSVLGSVALDFCRLLPVELESFTIQQQIKALALYGLAQGHLGRFEEAHRRLSDARALIRSMKTEDRHVPLGITELRRAEVFCLQACECGAILASVRLEDIDEDKREEKYEIRGILDYSIFQESISEDLTLRLPVISKDKAQEKTTQVVIEPPTQVAKERLKNILERYELTIERWDESTSPKYITISSPKGSTMQETLSRISKLQQARVGDAWRCVEEARREFVGRTHSERWWGRLYTLEMRVFGESGMAMSHCKQQSCFEAEHFRMLPFRSRRDVAHYLGKVWKKCIGVAGDGEEDLYERCRATLLYRFSLSIYGFDAVHSISKEDMKMAVSEIEKFREKSLREMEKLRRDDLRSRFLKGFQIHIEKWAKNVKKELEVQ